MPTPSANGARGMPARHGAQAGTRINPRSDSGEVGRPGDELGALDVGIAARPAERRLLLFRRDRDQEGAPGGGTDGRVGGAAPGRAHEGVGSEDPGADGVGIGSHLQLDGDRLPSCGWGLRGDQRHWLLRARTARPWLARCRRRAGAGTGDPAAGKRRADKSGCRQDHQEHSDTSHTGHNAALRREVTRPQTRSTKSKAAVLPVAASPSRTTSAGSKMESLEFRATPGKNSCVVR